MLRRRSRPSGHEWAAAVPTAASLFGAFQCSEFAVTLDAGPTTPEVHRDCAGGDFLVAAASWSSYRPQARCESRVGVERSERPGFEAGQQCLCEIFVRRSGSQLVSI